MDRMALLLISAQMLIMQWSSKSFEFQIYHYKWRPLQLWEGGTNLYKFFHCDENIESY